MEYIEIKWDELLRTPHHLQWDAVDVVAPLSFVSEILGLHVVPTPTSYMRDAPLASEVVHTKKRSRQQLPMYILLHRKGQIWGTTSFRNLIPEDHVAAGRAFRQAPTDKCNLRDVSAGIYGHENTCINLGSLITRISKCIRYPFFVLHKFSLLWGPRGSKIVSHTIPP